MDAYQGGGQVGEDSEGGVGLGGDEGKSSMDVERSQSLDLPPSCFQATKLGQFCLDGQRIVSI